MDIKIGYTGVGRKFAEEFDINENVIILRLQKLLNIKALSVSKNEIQLLIPRVIGKEGKEHTIYGFISKQNNCYTFKVDMISILIASKPYNAAETIAKAKIK